MTRPADDFSPLEQAAWGGLLGTHGRLLKAIDANLQQRHGISHVQFEALLRLSWTPDRRMRIQDLAEQSILSPSGMSRAVARLEQLGYVERTPAAEDGRGAYAVLTGAGSQQFEAALRTHVAFVRAAFLDELADDELEQLAGVWRRIDTRARATALDEGIPGSS